MRKVNSEKGYYTPTLTCEIFDVSVIASGLGFHEEKLFHALTNNPPIECPN